MRSVDHVVMLPGSDAMLDGALPYDSCISCDDNLGVRLVERIWPEIEAGRDPADDPSDAAD